MALLVLTKGCFHGVGDQDPEAGEGGHEGCREGDHRRCVWVTH